jgi:two-component sensor histidine kinase
VGVQASREARTSENRGSDYVTIFVRQLEGKMVHSAPEDAGNSISIKFPAPSSSTDGTAPLAA